MVRRLVQTMITPQDHPHKQTPLPTYIANDQILPVPNPTKSYWLSQPHKHANLRSTKDLPKRCDIAIIGSGMAGVLTAYNILKEYDTSTTASSSSPPPYITLLDARALCSGATGRNGGHAKVKTASLAGLSTDEERNELQAYVFRVMDELKAVVDAEDGLGAECEFEMRRSFDVFCDAGEGHEVLRIYNEARGKGERWVKTIGVLEGGMAESVTGIKGAKVAFSSRAVSLWPYKFVCGILERMIERVGVVEHDGGDEGEKEGKQKKARLNVQMDTPILSVHQDSQGINVLRTHRGVLLADKVVFATNAYTAGLVESFKDSIVPRKGMASHHATRTPVFPHLNNTYNIHFPPTTHGDHTGCDYLNPRPDGGIVVGGGGWYFKHDTSSWRGNFDDSTRFSEHVESHWAGYMQSTFRGWEGGDSVPDCVWVGIMGATADGKPHVGRVIERSGKVVKGQWVLAGFNGGGMVMIGILSKAIGKMVVGDKGFEDVWEEFGIPADWGTGLERLGGGGKEVMKLGK